jgi:hypothetical protein
MNLLKINVDSTLEVLDVEENRSLEALQKAVGGFIDVVRLHLEGSTSYDLIINDEGAINGMRPNFGATMLLWSHVPAHAGQTVVFGDVVLAGCNTNTGNTVGVNDMTIDKMYKDWRLNREQ